MRLALSIGSGITFILVLVAIALTPSPIPVPTFPTVCIYKLSPPSEIPPASPTHAVPVPER